MNGFLLGLDQRKVVTFHEVYETLFAGSNSVIKKEKKIKEMKKKLKMKCYLYMVPTSPNTHAFTSLV